MLSGFHLLDDQFERVGHYFAFVEDGDELESFVDHPNCHFSASGMGAGDDAVLFGGVED